MFFIKKFISSLESASENITTKADAIYADKNSIKVPPRSNTKKPPAAPLKRYLIQPGNLG